MRSIGTEDWYVIDSVNFKQDQFYETMLSIDIPSSNLPGHACALSEYYHTLAPLSEQQAKQAYTDYVCL